MEYAEQMEELDKKIVQHISKRTNLKVSDIRKKTLREIEIEQKIQSKPPKNYFKWEAGEKTGWQTQNRIFVTEKQYEKREKRLNNLLDL